MSLIKNELLDLKKEIQGKNSESEERILLPGKKPVLLATTLFVPESDIQSNTFFQQNSLGISFLDELIFKISREMGIYGVIDYIPMSVAMNNLKKYQGMTRYYYDQDMRKDLKDFGIDAFYVLNNGRFIVNRQNDKATIHEHNSSFSFFGLTGISQKLAEMFDDADVAYHTVYGGGLNLDDFNKLKIRLTDDVILYNELMNFAHIRNKNVERKNMWPRTLDLSLNDSFDLQAFEDIFTEYLEWVIQELNTKGTYEAMSPMLKRSNNGR